MWIYEKRLEFPVNIKEPNAKMAMFIMSQYGGPDGDGCIHALSFPALFHAIQGMQGSPYRYWYRRTGPSGDRGGYYPSAYP